MSWPSPQEFNEAIQNPRSCFRDMELRNGQPELNALGLPRPITGSFASVYRMRCKTRDWAVRCFLREVPDQEFRYQSLSEFITADDLECTVWFEYLREGIKIRGRWYPILKMEWVEGETLVEFVERNLHNPAALLVFAEHFKKTVEAMQQSGIAHGDLQHGNIMVVAGDQIRLVDYDGMFVPRLQNEKSNELGHANYQHPLRTAEHFGPYLDNFSAWLIYLSLRFLARDPALWKQHSGGDECMLLRKSDFSTPLQSKSLRELSLHMAQDVRQGVQILLSLLDLQPQQIPPISAATGALLEMEEIGVRHWLDGIIYKLQRWREKIVQSSQTHKTALQFFSKNEAQPDQDRESDKTKLPDWIVDYLQQNALPTPNSPALLSKKVMEESFASLQTPANIQPAQTEAQPHVSDTAVANLNQTASVDNLQASAPTSQKQRKPNVEDQMIRAALRYAGKHCKRNEYKLALALLQSALKSAGSSQNIRLQTEILRKLAFVNLAEADYLAAKHQFGTAAKSYEQARASLIELNRVAPGATGKNDDLLESECLLGAAGCYKMDGKFIVAGDYMYQAARILRRYPHMQMQLRSIEKARDQLPKT